VNVASYLLLSSVVKVNGMVFGQNDNYKLLSPTPINNGAFGSVGTAMYFFV
jgi:hypothetical protein